MESDLAEKGWEADCFVETISNVVVVKGDTELKTHGVEGVNMTPDEYLYLEGTAPQNKHEIAMSYVVADKLNVAIGDTVTVKTLDGETECMITATYQTMMSMGDNIRLYPGQTFSFKNLVGINDFQIRFHDNPSSSEIEKRAETMSLSVLSMKIPIPLFLFQKINKSICALSVIMVGMSLHSYRIIYI